MIGNLSDFDAVIYDMDGVLTDSEPIWKIAMQEVFERVGCSLTKEDFQKTVGLRIDEVIRYWFAVAPWDNASPEEVENAIVQRMVELLSVQTTPLPGVLESLKYFSSKGLKIGLATSSYNVLIQTILETLGITSFFNAVHSAEDEPYGKPHPSVYLSAAHSLDCVPTRCLVIEDSFNGVIAGKAARMKVVCIPEKSHHPDNRLVAADLMLDNLNELVNYFDTNA